MSYPDAILLRGIMAAKYRRMGKDDFRLLWNELDPTIRQMWVNTSEHIREHMPREWDDIAIIVAEYIESQTGN